MAPRTCVPPHPKLQTHVLPHPKALCSAPSRAPKPRILPLPKDMGTLTVSSPPCRDVSSVELLMSDHQSLKNEIEARAKSISSCVELGKSLILSKSPAAEEVRPLMGPNPLGVPNPLG